MSGCCYGVRRPVLKSSMMNWLDIVLIGLMAIGALRGFRIGLFGAVVNVFALILGWLVASQIAYGLGLAGGYFDWSSSSVIVAVYVIVIALTVAAVQFSWKIIRKSLGIATLGASSSIDRIGGLLLGVVLGGALAGALVLGLARFTYDMPLEGGGAPRASNQARDGLERSLAESLLVKIFIEETEGLPLNAFGFITPGFAESLELVGRKT